MSPSRHHHAALNSPAENALSQLQARFQRHILHDDAAITGDIAGPDDEYRRERLQIYYRAYRLRLIAALSVDFPALKAYTGEAVFEKLASAYIDARPSAFRNLRWFGGGLAGFLRDDPRFSGDAVLGELAEFEWAQGLAFDAADAPQLSFAELAAVDAEDWPNLRFIAHPSLQLVPSHWNVVAIWHAHRNGTALPAAQRQQQADTIAVWRRDYRTFFRTLESDETALWQFLSRGRVFSEACSLLSKATAEDDVTTARRAAQLLRTWIEEGWLQAFHISTED